jgi:hypothetical protein
LSAHGFRSVSLPLPGGFSPFPHGTRPLAVVSGMQPWRVVPPASHKISRVPWYSGSPATARTGGYGSLTRSAGPFQVTSPVAWVVSCRAHNPQRNAGFGLCRVRSPLLTASQLISLPRGTEMFQFPRCPSAALCIQAGIADHAVGWVAPFGDSRISACARLPENVSARAPSFIGLGRLGIPHALLKA